MRLDTVKITRLLELCQEIADVQKHLPQPPPGVDVSKEIAKQLRPVLLERHGPALRELGRLLR